VLCPQRVSLPLKKYAVITDRSSELCRAVLPILSGATASCRLKCPFGALFLEFKLAGSGVGARCTVKKIYRIPVFFFTKPFRNGKTPMLTRDFLVPTREGIFCLLRREKYSSLCRGNFFLSVECYISLFPLFPY
jgi:hypothetical protein